jgi:hypothetical protein
MNDMSAMAMPEEQAFEATMNAVIVYDDVAFASKAQAMLGQAAHRADAGLPWSLKPWRLELLILPPTAARALQDAAEAHLLVLAVRRPADPSPRLLDWLEQWACCRQFQDAALAVFDGESGDMLSGTKAPELSQFAERHGLSLILGDVGLAEEESALLVPSLHERAAAQTTTLLGILEQAPSDRYWARGHQRVRVGAVGARPSA